MLGWVRGGEDAWWVGGRWVVGFGGGGGIGVYGWRLMGGVPARGWRGVLCGWVGKGIERKVMG